MKDKQLKQTGENIDLKKLNDTHLVHFSTVGLMKFSSLNEDTNYDRKVLFNVDILKKKEFKVCSTYAEPGVALWG